MVLNLTEGDKLELRSLDNWQETKAYIEERAEAAKKEEMKAASPTKIKAATLQGFGDQSE